jgi:hypothetical protein
MFFVTSREATPNPFIVRRQLWTRIRPPLFLHNELRELGSEGRRRVRIFQCRARSDFLPLALLKDFVDPVR